MREEKERLHEFVVDCGVAKKTTKTWRPITHLDQETKLIIKHPMLFYNSILGVPLPFSKHTKLNIRIHI